MTISSSLTRTGVGRGSTGRAGPYRRGSDRAGLLQALLAGTLVLTLVAALLAVPTRPAAAQDDTTDDSVEEIADPDSYRPCRGIDGDPDQMHVVFVLDQSASLGTIDRGGAQRREALNTVLGSLIEHQQVREQRGQQGFLQVALVGFGVSADTHAELDTVSSDHPGPNEIESALLTGSASGLDRNTNYGSGLEEALQIFAGSAESDRTCRLLVFVTDGVYDPIGTVQGPATDDFPEIGLTAADVENTGRGLVDSVCSGGLSEELMQLQIETLAVVVTGNAQFDAEGNNHRARMAEISKEFLFGLTGAESELLGDIDREACLEGGEVSRQGLIIDFEDIADLPEEFEDLFEEVFAPDLECEDSVVVEPDGPEASAQEVCTISVANVASEEVIQSVAVTVSAQNEANQIISEGPRPRLDISKTFTSAGEETDEIQGLLSLSNTTAFLNLEWPSYGDWENNPGPFTQVITVEMRWMGGENPETRNVDITLDWSQYKAQIEMEREEERLRQEEEQRMREEQRAGLVVCEAFGEQGSGEVEGTRGEPIFTGCTAYPPPSAAASFQVDINLLDRDGEPSNALSSSVDEFELPSGGDERQINLVLSESLDDNEHTFEGQVTISVVWLPAGEDPVPTTQEISVIFPRIANNASAFGIALLLLLALLLLAWVAWMMLSRARNAKGGLLPPSRGWTWAHKQFLVRRDEMGNVSFNPALETYSPSRSDIHPVLATNGSWTLGALRVSPTNTPVPWSVAGLQVSAIGFNELSSDPPGIAPSTIQPPTDDGFVVIGAQGNRVAAWLVMSPSTEPDELLPRLVEKAHTAWGEAQGERGESSQQQPSNSVTPPESSADGGESQNPPPPAPDEGPPPL